MKRIIRIVAVILCVIIAPFLEVCVYAIDEVNLADYSQDSYVFSTSSIIDQENNDTLSLTSINYTTVKTPNGSNVSVSEYNISLLEEEIANADAEMQEWYPNAEMLSSANPNYNCHSYAWYSQSSDNPYWMNYPNQYYDDSDKSYVEVHGDPRPDDIICYFNYYGENIHSAIVTNIEISDEVNELGYPETLITVESKFGGYGVYSHLFQECPYTPEAHNYSELTFEAKRKNIATSIKFYRPRTDGEYTVNSESTCIETDKNIISDDNIEDTYSMYEFNIIDNGYYDFEVSSNSDLEILLYDSYMQSIVLTATSVTDFSYRYMLYLTEGRYYLRSAYVDASHSGVISITAGSHNNHEYEYVIVSDFYHILKCDCGATSGIQEGHIYTGSGLIGYVKCIQCGFLKYVGNTTIPIIKGKIPTIEAICKE